MKSTLEKKKNRKIYRFNAVTMVYSNKLMVILTRLDEVQEELVYYPGVSVGIGSSISISKMLKFLCDGQGAVRRAILSL